MDIKNPKQQEHISLMKKRYPAKKEFIQRIEQLLGKEEAKIFFEICYTDTPNSIRCNTLKIKPNELKERLEKYNWDIKQPFTKYPEIMIVKNTSPGEIGKSKEHLLGYFYVQEISSMLPMLILKPKPNEFILDLCASPGSKTTQAASMMENTGTIIANEVNLGRVGILNTNLERCGVTNTIVTKKEGVSLCNILSKKTNIKFDKILVDAPCTGEGTLRKSPKTFLMWNQNMIYKISNIQKRLANNAIKLLKIGGTMIYSTCTLSPEENEYIIDDLIKNHNIEIQEIKLPLKFREGITCFNNKQLSPEIKKCLRLYPQDNDTDGFFIAKIKKLGEKNEN